MSHFKAIALHFNFKHTLKKRAFGVFFGFIFINSNLGFALENAQCTNFLLNKNLTKSIEFIFKNLNLPHPNASQTKDSSGTSLGNSLQLFKNSLSKLNGGQKLIEIFELGEVLSAQDFKFKIRVWAKEFLPGYEILYLQDVENFNFENYYKNTKIPFYDKKSGILDDKFLFELYSKKRIPILNQTDLISQILVLAQPKLRAKFEKLVRLYQRAQALGDLTTEDQMHGGISINPAFANKNRLSYISTLAQLLTGRLVFLSPDDNQRRLVLWGNDNLMNPIDFTKQKMTKLKSYIDLSLIGHPNALSYFNQQSEKKNKSALGLFLFLTKHKILPKPAHAHVEFPMFAQEALHWALSHIDLIQIESGFEATRNNLDPHQAWVHFSNMLYYDDTNPISQILRYRFRFEWINHYINIVEEDISATEPEAHKTDPGPLFR